MCYISRKDYLSARHLPRCARRAWPYALQKYRLLAHDCSHAWRTVAHSCTVCQHVVGHDAEQGRHDKAALESKRMRQNQVPYAQMAVLYRNHSLSRVIEEMLTRAGIPYRIFGGTRFYDRKEIRDAILANPYIESIDYLEIDSIKSDTLVLNMGLTSIYGSLEMKGLEITRE